MLVSISHVMLRVLSRRWFSTDAASQKFARLFPLHEKPQESQKARQEFMRELCHQKPAQLLDQLLVALDPSLKWNFPGFLKELAECRLGMVLDMRENLLKRRWDSGNQEALSQMDAQLKNQLAEKLLDNSGDLYIDQLSLESDEKWLNAMRESDRVHPILDNQALYQRLGMYRRVFVLRHMGMNDRILVLLQTAFMPDIPRTIQSILQEPVLERSEDMKRRDCAIFYSISSAQPGLSGLNLGQWMLKRAKSDLQEDFPHLNHFCTLSPVPGLYKFIKQLSDDEYQRIVDQAIAKHGSSTVPRPTRDVVLGSLCPDMVPKSSTMQKKAKRISKKDDGKIIPTVLELSCRHCLGYRSDSKSLTPQGDVHDPVGRFHLLNNGAWLYRVNVELYQGCYQVMVNYSYDERPSDSRL